MSRFKQKAPDPYDVDEELKRLLDNDIKIQDIDAKWMDKVMYWYPSKYLRWVSLREQKARSK